MGPKRNIRTLDPEGYLLVGPGATTIILEGTVLLDDLLAYTEKWAELCTKIYEYLKRHAETGFPKELTEWESLLNEVLTYGSDPGPEELRARLYDYLNRHALELGHHTLTAYRLEFYELIGSLTWPEIVRRFRILHRLSAQFVLSSPQDNQVAIGQNKVEASN